MTGSGIYSSGEQRIMHAWQQRKDAWLWPITKALHTLGITPTIVSLLGVVFAWAGLYFSWRLQDGRYFVIALWLHVLLDGLDGALARNHKLTTEHGDVIDIAADLDVALAALLFMWFTSTISLTVLTATAVGYTALLSIGLVRNRRGIPYVFMPRGRLVFYILLTIDATLGLTTLAWALPIWLGINGILLITGVAALLRHTHYLSSNSTR